MAISIPHSFTNGAIAEAAEVNANFNAVASFVNNLQDGSGLDSGSITTAKLVDSSVSSSKIATDAVTSAKILDGSVTTAKIPDSGITAAKLAADSVTTAKIASNAVTLAKLATDAVPGVALISSTTIGSAVSTITVSNAFSATYDNYKIIVSGGTSSASSYFLLQFGNTTTNYNSVAYYVLSPAGNEVWSYNGSAMAFMGSASANGLNANIEIISPYLAKNTIAIADHWFYDQGGGGFSRGLLSDTTSYTDFKLTASSGTITGGTIKVYGYKN